jgi:hypothetical protein
LELRGSSVLICIETPKPASTVTPLRVSHRSILLFSCVLTLTLFACEGIGRGTAPGVSRDAFIDVYVELRVAALRTEEGVLPDSARSRILADHGVTEDALHDFVDDRASDLAFMRDLWNTIEARLDSVPPVAVEDTP